MIRIEFESASNALEACLPLAVIFGNATTMTAFLAGVLWRDFQQLPAQPGQLVAKLPYKFSPALVKN